MLTDDLKCDDCLQRGSDCECPKIMGPTWSKERRAFNAEREKYDALMWWNKLECWNPVDLAVWQSGGQCRLVPTFEQATRFGIERKANPCFVD